MKRLFPTRRDAAVGTVAAGMALLTALGIAQYNGVAMLPFGHKVDTWTFEAPTTGSPVETYLVHIYAEVDPVIGGGGQVKIYVGNEAYRVEVAGVDSLARQGPFSETGYIEAHIVGEGVTDAEPQ